MIAIAHPTTRVEEYIESMQTWIRVTPTRSVRKGSHAFEREDLEQIAVMALLEVFNNPRYAGKVAALDCPCCAPYAAIELQKIGRYAIFRRCMNLYHKWRKDSPRCGECANCTKKWPGPCSVMRTVPIDTVTYRTKTGMWFERRDGAEVRPTLGPCDEALERLVLMDEVEALADQSAEARAMLAAAMNLQDARPADLAGAQKIFGRAMRGLLHRDGYLQVDEGAVHTNQEDDDMTGLETPDQQEVVTASPVAEKPKTPKAPKASKAPKAEKAGGKLQTAAETAKASGTFKNGDKVTYIGGARAVWLKKDATLEVKGKVVSRGRTYVRCYVIAEKRPIVLSSLLIRIKK